MPAYPSACTIGVPEWTPIRTVRSSPSGQSSEPRSRCARTTAAIASGADSKTTKKLSPSVPISTPPWADQAERSVARIASRASM